MKFLTAALILTLTGCGASAEDPYPHVCKGAEDLANGMRIISQYPCKEITTWPTQYTTQYTPSDDQWWYGHNSSPTVGSFQENLGRALVMIARGWAVWPDTTQPVSYHPQMGFELPALKPGSRYQLEISVRTVGP